MGMLGKLIAGRLVAKAAQRIKQKNAAMDVQRRGASGEYIPAGTGAMPARTGLAYKAVDFYEKNPKLVAGAATLIMAALAASLSKGTKPR